MTQKEAEEAAIKASSKLGKQARSELLLKYEPKVAEAILQAIRASGLAISFDTDREAEIISDITYWLMRGHMECTDLVNKFKESLKQ